MNATTLFIIGIVVAAGLLAIGVFTVAGRRPKDETGITAPLDRVALQRDRRARRERAARSAAAVAVLSPPETDEEYDGADEAPPPVDPMLERTAVSASQLGVTRRGFFNRALLTVFGIFLGQFAIAGLAFMWPKLGEGFGSPINLGNLNDLRSEIIQGDGSIVPTFVASAQTWLVPMPENAIAGSSFEGLPVVIGAGGGEPGLMALWQRCVHLGCRVPSCVPSQGFECPCHGSRYNFHGEYEAGPAPRNMDRFAVELDDADNLIVQTGQVIETPRASTKTIQYPQGTVLRVSVLGHVVALVQPILAVTEGEAPVGPSNVGVGSVVLTVVGVAFLAWVGWLVLSSRRRAPAVEETPSNLQQYLSDDELENKRVTRVLNSGLVVAAVLALTMPIYFVNEAGRQDRASEKSAEQYVEEGEHWFTEFACIDCHGPDGGGGAAPFVEARSGLSTTWAVPSLNDVFFRYSEEEVRQWIIHGRQGTPMPANGLEGGGAMTMQEIDQVVAYLYSIQIEQSDATAEVTRIVATETDRLANAAAAVDRLLLEQRATILDIFHGPERFAVIEAFPGEIKGLMAADGTCTDASAGAVGSSCGQAGTDSDRDGLTDAMERRMTEVGAVVDDTVLIRQVQEPEEPDGEPAVEEIRDPELTGLYGLSLDPANAFTNTDATGAPIADLQRATTFLTELDTAHLTLGVLTERNDVFMESAEAGLAFLEEAASHRPWQIDVEGVSSQSGLTDDEAIRAAALFNGYCARCHTAGYSAGVAFTQEAGSGAWGPSLLDRRAVTQFPDVADHIAFVAEGSEANVSYGINGLGTGRMPAFGQILSAEDIELIVAFERAL